MASLESTFSREDIETLIDSLTDWELSRNQEYHLMEMIKSAPMPPEDHEAYDMMLDIKNQFRQRERDIIDTRKLCQERAVMLKAKLMLARQELAIDQLFDFASNTTTEEVAPKKEKDVTPKTEVPESEAKKSLDLAEHFIKDLGVWDHYQKFLSEN